MYEVTLITTVDNPFDPFEDFANWNRWDQDHGYNTWSYVLRLANLSDELTKRESDDEISAVCQEIAYYNWSGKHRKVSKMVNESED